jgi:hypothetical protein
MEIFENFLVVPAVGNIKTAIKNPLKTLSLKGAGAIIYRSFF